MAKYLKFSPDVRIPAAEAIAQQWAFLGRTGQGKSYGAGVLAECLLGQKKQVVVLDPVGNWWGLRIGKDGGPGFNIPVFGGLRGDVPLKPEAGAMIAKLVVERRISCVIDVSHMRKAEARRFATDFAEELFEAKKRQRSRMMLIIEEAQRFVPQKSDQGDKKMLGAFEDVAKIGRQFGIFWAVITQRPQSVNKDVLNQAEPLVVLQLTGKHERKAVREWIDEHGVEVDEMFKRISKLKKGEAFFWSPAWLEVLAQIKIGKKRTYDSTATPDDDEEMFEPEPMSKRDLEKLGKDIERVAEEAEANDPTRLRQRISKLERDLATAQREQPAPEPEEIRIEVPILSSEDRDWIRDCTKSFDKVVALGLSERLIELVRIADKPSVEVAKVAASVRRAARAPTRTPPTRPVPPTQPPGTNSDVKLRRGAVRMLQALATMNRDLTRGQVAMLSGMSHRSSTFSTYLTDLRREALIEDRDSSVSITAAGVAYLGGNYGDTPRTMDAVARLFESRLRAGAWRMMTVILKHVTISRSELAAAAEMSNRSSTFSTYLTDLKRTGMVTVEHGEIRLNDDLVAVAG